MISDEIESPNTEELQLQQQSPFTTPSGSEESPSMWLSCIAPFQDPAPETENIVLSRMRERIEKEEFHVELKATPEEKSDILLKRFLHRHLYDLEVALVQWHGYVEWRHAQQLDQITEESIQNEREEGIFAWRGENKEGMPCCVITGRMLDPTNRKGTFVSFKKHLIKFVDEGLYHADQQGKEKICIIYDRRGLEYEHIDPNLYQFCNKTINELREWYGDRIGVIYVLYTNYLFWILYTLLIRPFMLLLSKDNRLVLVDTSEDLLDYFDAEQLMLLSPTLPSTNESRKEASETSESTSS